MLGLLALVLLLTVQVVQLAREQLALSAALAGQDAALEEGDRVRRQLDGLLAGTSGLARDGNPAAQSVLETLRRQGIVYTPPGS